MDQITGPLILLVVVAAKLIRVGARELAAARDRAVVRDRLHAGAARIVDNALVTVVGVVRARAPHQLLEAPLSGRRVVYHRSVARPRKLEREVVAVEMTPFELETADGIVRIEGDAADVVLPPAPVIPLDIHRVQRFLAEHGVGAEYAARTGVEEIAIEPGARITVQGVAHLEADPARADEGGYRERPPARVTLEPTPEHPLTIGPA